MPERLHKVIAQSGVASRRGAEQMIKEGLVSVNGKVIREMGVKVEPTDQIMVSGELLKAQELVYIVMNKPKGVVTTMKDPQGRPTVLRHLPRLDVVVKPVGRLDMETEGLLLFTNDGLLAQRMTHPRYGVEKEYFAVLNGIIDERALERLRTGVQIEDGMTAPAVVRVERKDSKLHTTGLSITIHEGRYRQVRQMCEVVGYPVRSLRRVRLGPLYVKGMTPGECKTLGYKEVAALKSMVGL